jgi:REP element-mobilizing transposase RayT
LTLLGRNTESPGPRRGWFFTVNLLDRRQTLLVDHIADLREAVAATRQTRRFEIAAFVVLPRSFACNLEVAAGR